MFLAPANKGDEEAYALTAAQKDLNFYIQIDEDEGYIISYRTNSTALGLLVC
jgi:hypothetical protein